MPQAPDSLERIWPPPGGSGPTNAMTEPQPQPAAVEGAEATPPQFDRVAEVLGPLEQVVLAADQKLGAIQQQVSTQAGEESAHVERRVRDAANAQRRRIADLKQELTARRSDVSARFDAILQLIDEVDRDLALRAGVGAPDVQVTLTERQTVEIAHDVAPLTDLAAVAAGQAATAPAAGQTPTAPAAEAKQSEPRKPGRFARLFRRSKRSSD